MQGRTWRDRRCGETVIELAASTGETADGVARPYPVMPDSAKMRWTEVFLVRMSSCRRPDSCRIVVQ